MEDRLRKLGERRHMKSFKGLQQRLTGRPPGRALGIASVESGQVLPLFSQLAPHLVFQQTEHAQPQREQAEQACHPLSDVSCIGRTDNGRPFKRPKPRSITYSPR